MQGEREVMCLEFVTIAPNLKGTVINYSWGGCCLDFMQVNTVFQRGSVMIASPRVPVSVSSLLFLPLGGC